MESHKKAVDGVDNPSQICAYVFTVIKWLQMTCPNCGSDDIVAIQNHNYCIACGQLIAAHQAAAKSLSGFKSTTTRPVLNPSRSVLSAKLQSPKRPARRPIDLAASLNKAVAGRSTLAPASTKKSKEIPQAIKSHPFSFSLKVAALVALPFGLFTALSWSLAFDADITVYGLGVALLVSTFSLIMSRSAILYGLSKKLDGRVVPREVWWLAARNGFLDLVNLNLLGIILLLLLGFAAFGFWVAVDSFSGNIPALKVAGLVVANSLVAWFGLGVFVAHRMGVPAVIIGGLTPWKAFRLSWIAYEKVGGHLIIAAAEALLVRLTAILVVLAAALVTFTYTNDEQMALAAGTVATISLFVVFTVALQIESRLWLSQYRHWLPECFPDLRLELLFGRRHLRP